jgi:hypothetical protein
MEGLSSKPLVTAVFRLENNLFFKIAQLLPKQENREWIPSLAGIYAADGSESVLDGLPLVFLYSIHSSMA